MATARRALPATMITPRSLVTNPTTPRRPTPVLRTLLVPPRTTPAPTRVHLKTSLDTVRPTTSLRALATTVATPNPQARAINLVATATSHQVDMASLQTQATVAVSPQARVLEEATTRPHTETTLAMEALQATRILAEA